MASNEGSPSFDAVGMPRKGSHMVDMCPGCQNTVRPMDKFCSNCALPLAAGPQQINTSHVGNHNIGSGIGNTLQGNQFHIYGKLDEEPVATIERTTQKQLKIFGIPIKTTYLIIAGALSVLANLADINSGFLTGNYFQRYLNDYVGIVLTVFGAFCLMTGIFLYRKRFVSMIGPYGLQPGNDRSMYWIKVSGTCPICSGELTLRDIGPRGNTVKMVVCKTNPDHSWRFDPTVLGDIE
jgi:hypothetical protein